jgi:hypothetical protein
MRDIRYYFNEAQNLLTRCRVLIVETYPNKFAGVTCFVADLCYAYSSYELGSLPGIATGLAFSVASGLLVIYGDPQISSEQLKHFVDPQDHPFSLRRALKPSLFPWETFAFLRTPPTFGMLWSGLSYGPVTEAVAAALGLIGNAIKFIPEQPRDTMALAPVQHSFALAHYMTVKTIKFLRENPVRVAGICYIASTLAFNAGAICQLDGPKMAAGLLWLTPGLVTSLLGRKRTKLPVPEP